MFFSKNLLSQGLTTATLGPKIYTLHILFTVVADTC